MAIPSSAALPPPTMANISPPMMRTHRPANNLKGNNVSLRPLIDKVSTKCKGDYPAPQDEKSLLVWNVNAVSPATTPAVRKKACTTTATS